MKRSLYSIIKELEKAAQVSPPTTRASYVQTTENERRDYIRWLSKQAPLTASFAVPFDLL